MHSILVILAVLAVTALAVMGGAATATGWVPPWGGYRILRPRLWGSGMVVSAVGMAAFMFLGPLGDLPPAYASIPLAGMGAYLVGLLLQTLARRPGRAPRAPTGPVS
ncbi:hypothetical protein ACFYWX_05545 [Streptomyces sp. NPDC002888]|uniref:hypothetical protein n=1 Tax=Streptomyces sp. NPDC002888 TaxID=3364668 RepID=UPI00367E96BC